MITHCTFAQLGGTFFVTKEKPNASNLKPPLNKVVVYTISLKSH